MGQIHEDKIVDIIWFDQEPQDQTQKQTLIQDAENQLKPA